MLTASRPLVAYFSITSSAPGPKSKLILKAAFSAITLTSGGSNDRKKISTHRERMAGEISSGSLVVAPTRRKSAGSPCWKMSWMWAGM